MDLNIRSVSSHCSQTLPQCSDCPLLASGSLSLAPESLNTAQVVGVIFLFSEIKLAHTHLMHFLPQTSLIFLFLSSSPEAGGHST